MSRLLAVSVGLITIAIGAAIRLVLVRLHLVNGSVEIYMPLTYVGIGTALLVIKNRIALALLIVAAVIGLAVVGLLIALAGAAPFAR